MKRTPTDLEFLEAIYDKYYDAFLDYRENPPNRSSKNFVPIDIHVLAKHFGIDSDIVFGRLYYHLEKKYGYDVPSSIKDQAPTRVSFFAMRIGGDRHCIHFPYLAGVIAGLRYENRKFWIPTTVSVVSLCIALVSAAVTISTKLS